MNPATILMMLSMAGGIMQAAGGRHVVDPAFLQRMFGPEAVTKETIAMFNNVLSSPYGQKIMTNAAENGAQFRNDTASRAAGAGFGGDAESGSSIFSKAAADGATNGMQRDAQSGIMAQVAPIAAQNVAERMRAYMDSYNNTNSPMYNLGAQVGNAASAGLVANNATKSNTTSTTAPVPVTAPLAGPQSTNSNMVRPLGPVQSSNSPLQPQPQGAAPSIFPSPRLRPKFSSDSAGGRRF